MDKDEVIQLRDRIIDIAEKARREGLLAIDEEVDQDKAQNLDILNLGLQMVVDGIDGKDIEDILVNLRNNDLSEIPRMVLDMIIVGVLSIQCGDNPRIIDLKMISRVPEDIRPERIKF
jgi:flagellar motor component MotA